MKTKVYVCYEEKSDAYNECYDSVVKVVSNEEDAIKWRESGHYRQLNYKNEWYDGYYRSYEEFVLDEKEKKKK